MNKDSKTYVRILLDGLTMNGQVCMAGDIMEDPPFAVMQLAKAGGVLGEKGKVVEEISASEVEKLLGDGKLHAPEKTKHVDPEGYHAPEYVKDNPAAKALEAEKKKKAASAPSKKEEAPKEKDNKPADKSSGKKKSKK